MRFFWIFAIYISCCVTCFLAIMALRITELVLAARVRATTPLQEEYLPRWFVCFFLYGLLCDWLPVVVVFASVCMSRFFVFLVSEAQFIRWLEWCRCARSSNLVDCVTCCFEGVRNFVRVIKRLGIFGDDLVTYLVTQVRVKAVQSAFYPWSLRIRSWLTLFQT